MPGEKGDRKEYLKNYMVEYRKKKKEGKEEKKRGRKIVPLENEIEETKKENVRERKRRSRAKKKDLVLQVRVGTQPPQIKEEPVYVWLDDDNGDVLMPDVNEDNHNHDNNDRGDGSSTTSPPSVIKAFPAVRLQSPTRPSHHHTPGLITPELFSSLSSFATSTPGPSHVSCTPGPSKPTSRSCSNSSR
jgi:hypothetical protein